uniref:Alternative protein MMD2 n=1 Tax=Homo sapiens TaxID=9606 RepID=L0R6K8_HUMAN|nr:alternative protein MMD2 [Homo sapiens]
MRMLLLGHFFPSPKIQRHYESYSFIRWGKQPPGTCSLLHT